MVVSSRHQSLLTHSDNFRENIFEVRRELKTLTSKRREIGSFLSGRDGNSELLATVIKSLTFPFFSSQS